MDGRMAGLDMRVVHSIASRTHSLYIRKYIVEIAREWTATAAATAAAFGKQLERKKAQQQQNRQLNVMEAKRTYQLHAHRQKYNNYSFIIINLNVFPWS